MMSNEGKQPEAGSDDEASVRLTELQRRIADLEEMLTGVVGHDLRNPLSAIVTSVGVLKRLGSLDEPRQRCLEVIATSTERLKRFLADLDDLVRAAGSGIPLRLAPAHLDAVCQPVLRDLAVAHPGRELGYRTHGDGLGCWDAARLGQAVRNLVSNALRYGEPGSPVKVRWEGSNPSRVWLEVESCGPTIPGDILAELRRPFRRDRRPTSEREGLGLGIFLADHLVRGHGGSLQASSVAGRTVFRIELPRQAL